MRQTHQQQEPIQLELFKQTSQGWESALTTEESYNFTTEQIEHHFGILRKDLYKTRSKPYCYGSSTLLFLHIQKNKWQVYSLNPVQVGKYGKTSL